MDTTGLDITNQTPEGAATWLGKLFPSCYTHFRVMMTFFVSASRAKRGQYDDAAWIQHSVRIVQLVEHTGVRIEVEGASVLGTLDSPCIIVSNHMSTLETYALPSIAAPYCLVNFVIKKSLLEYPVFKHCMRSRNPIVVGRENPREDLAATLAGGVERVQAGESIIVFPQTTRTVAFDPAGFNTIGVKMARRAGVPVVPLALKTDAWSNGKKFKDFGRILPERPVHFSFGTPLHVTGNGRAEHEHIIQFIKDKLRTWKEADAHRS